MRPSCILLIEDNAKILEGNRYLLNSRGYVVDCAATLAEGAAAMKRRPPDLIILDIMLPDGSGLDFLVELRGNSDVPVLLLTGLGATSDMVRGLRLGGDDYLSKPYDFDVLLARVEAILRRARRVPERWEKNALRFDIVANQAFLDDEDMLLTPKQFALLLLLARNEGRTLSSEYLYETVWKMPHTADSNALWKQISQLKAKLSGRDDIELSVYRGEGYCLEIR